MTVRPGCVPDIIASTCAGVKRVLLILGKSVTKGPLLGGSYVETLTTAFVGCDCS